MTYPPTPWGHRPHPGNQPPPPGQSWYPPQPPLGMPPAPPRRRRSPLFWVLISLGSAVLGLVLFVVGANLKLWFDNQGRGEEARASAVALLDAIVAGDLATALQHLDTSGYDPAEFVSPELAASAAAASRISYEITEVKALESFANVTFTLTIDGESQEQKVMFDNTDDGWLPHGSSILVSIGNLEAPGTIYGTPFEAWSFSVGLPASYQYDLAPEFLVLEEPIVTLHPTDQMGYATILLRPEYHDQATTAYRELMASCDGAVGSEVPQCDWWFKDVWAEEDTVWRLITNPADSWRPQLISFSGPDESGIWKSKPTRDAAAPYQMSVTGTLHVLETGEVLTWVDQVVDITGYPIVGVSGDQLSVTAR